MNLSLKQKQTHRQWESWQPQVCGEGGRGLDWEFGTSRCKLLFVEWISKRALPYSMDNYIQCPVINQNGKLYIYVYGAAKWFIYIYIYIYVNSKYIWITLLHQKLIQRCKSTILQFFKMCYIYTIKYYSAMRRKEILPFETT